MVAGGDVFSVYDSTGKPNVKEYYTLEGGGGQGRRLAEGKKGNGNFRDRIGMKGKQPDQIDSLLCPLHNH